MQEEKKIFAGGGMDMDTEERLLKPNDYRYALNCRITSSDEENQGAIENVRGNKALFNENLKTDNGIELGNARFKVIGHYEDKKLNTFFYFVCDLGPSAFGGLFMPDWDREHCIVTNYTWSEGGGKPGSWRILIQNPSLNFHENYLITGVNIIHNDEYAPGGILYWTDDRNQPRKLNILRQYWWKTNPGGITDPKLSYLEDPIFFLDAIPKAPTEPPLINIGTWSEKKSNDLKQKLWQFKYRYVYRDGQKSSWSPISESITTRHTDGAINTNNIEDDNYIQIRVINGRTEVESIDIAARRNGAGDDFYLVGTINKDDSNQDNVSLVSFGNPGIISTNTVSSEIPTNLANWPKIYFIFTGEEPRIPIDLQESNKLYDDVPLKAKAQEIVDGNRLTYGNIVNGYDPVPTDCSFDVVYKETADLDYLVTVLDYDVEASVSTCFWVTVPNLPHARSKSRYKVKFNIPDMTNMDTGDEIILKLDGLHFAVSVQRHAWSCVDKEGVLVERVDVDGVNYVHSAGNTLSDLMAHITSNSQVTFTKIFENHTHDDTHIKLGAGHDTSSNCVAANWMNYSQTHTGWNTLWYMNSATNQIELRFMAYHDEDMNNITCHPHDYRTVIGVSASELTSNWQNGHINLTNPGMPIDGDGRSADVIPQYLSDWDKKSYYIKNTVNNNQMNLPYNGNIENNCVHITEPPITSGNYRGFKSGIKHHFGLVYYDSANRSGAVNKAGSVYVPSRHERDGGNLPIDITDYTAHIHFKINHLPPTWASHYQWVHSSERIENFVVVSAMNIFYDAEVVGKYDTKFTRSQTDDGGIATPGYQAVIDTASGSQNGAVLMDMEELILHSAKSSEHNFLWDWKKGDRVKIIDTVQLTGEDYEIIGVIEDVKGEYPSGTAAANCSSLTANNGSDSKLYFVLEHGANGTVTATNCLQDVLVEIYRPTPETEDFYHEFNHTNRIGLDDNGNRIHQANTWANGYNEGQLTTMGYLNNYVDSSGNYTPNIFSYNQNDSSNPDPDFPAEGTFLNGNIYVRERRFKNALANQGATGIVMVEDFSASDYWPSKAWDLGRPNAFLPDFKQTRREATVFFSEPFIPNTAINGLGTFYPDVSFKEYDKSYNSIQKLFSINDRLIILQEDKVSYAMVSRAVLFDASSTQNVALSNEVLSSSVPYVGDFGIARNPESFANFGFRSYFVDARSRAVLRLSQDGLTPISEHGMKNFFTDFFQEVIEEKRHITNSFKIYGAYDNKFDEYVISIPDIEWSYQDIQTGNTIYRSIEGFTIGFHEVSKRWNSFYGYKNNISMYNSELHSFNKGVIYQHNAAEDANGEPVYNNFYGTEWASILEFAVNKFPGTTKIFQNISEHANNIWRVDSFYTRNGQMTDLTLNDFTGGNTYAWEDGHGTKENIHYSIIKCDLLSGVPNPKIEGNRMRDTSAMCRLVLSNPEAQSQNVFFSVTFGFIISTNPTLINSQ